MKKAGILVVLILSCLWLCACKDIREGIVGTGDYDASIEKEMTLQERVDKGLPKCQLTDPEHILEKVKDIECPNAEDSEIPLKVITTEGDLYYLCLDKLYSNDTNFKKIDAPVKFERFLGDYAIGKDNKLYAVLDGVITELEGTFDWDDIREDYGTNIEDYAKLTNMSYEIYMKLEDNKLYDCKTEELLFVFADGVVVDYVLNDTVKTNDGWYAFSKICENQEEVDKYADVEPIYKLVCQKVLDADVDFYKDLATGGKHGIIVIDGSLYGMTGY